MAFTTVGRIPASRAGLVGASTAFAASLTPSLYPRAWVVQGVLSGVAAAVGYGSGALVGALRSRLAGAPARAGARAVGYRVAGVVAAGIALAALLWNARWQVDVRALQGVDGGIVAAVVAPVPVALVTGYLLVLLGRAVRAGHRGYERLLARVVPARWRHAARLLVTLVVLSLLVSGLPLGWATGAAAGALRAADASVDPGLARPSTTYRAGGPGSLVPWESLGAAGRAFVDQGPTVAELEAFAGEPARPPIRVYVGMRSAPTDRERASLAVAELERAGAFEREVLVVITPTGSGSVNPFAVDPLEYMYRGDTAAVAMQYGYLPSWVTMAGNQERAQQGATALFDAVSRRLRQEPPGSGPKLLVYGESLGSFGSEASFADIEDARARTDGVLWAGPTRGNRLWRELTANRDRGSPVWHPIHRGGRLVRFGWDGTSLMAPGADWPRPRVAYLQHATDPVTWHNPRLLVERPEWLDAPRGPDVADSMPFIPVVTAWQVTIDMMLGAGAPLGHGHMFGAEQAEAWALVAPPPDWTAQRTRSLVALLAAR